MLCSRERVSCTGSPISAEMSDQGGNASRKMNEYKAQVNGAYSCRLMMVSSDGDDGLAI